jgi:hypothetical protein
MTSDLESLRSEPCLISEMEGIYSLSKIPLKEDKVLFSRFRQVHEMCIKRIYWAVEPSLTLTRLLCASQKMND